MHCHGIRRLKVVHRATSCRSRPKGRPPMQRQVPHTSVRGQPGAERAQPKTLRIGCLGLVFARALSNMQGKRRNAHDCLDGRPRYDGNEVDVVRLYNHGVCNASAHMAGSNLVLQHVFPPSIFTSGLRRNTKLRRQSRSGIRATTFGFIQSQPMPQLEPN